jgi:uncharacterized protein YjiS (DUF1127 family)
MSRTLPLPVFSQSSGAASPSCLMRPHVLNLVKLLAAWRERARSRALLAHLSPRDVKDLGLSKADAWAEINKPFWRE